MGFDRRMSRNEGQIEGIREQLQAEGVSWLQHGSFTALHKYEPRTEEPMARRVTEGDRLSG